MKNKRYKNPADESHDKMWIKKRNEEIEQEAKKYYTDGDITAWQKLGVYLFDERLMRAVHNKCHVCLYKDLASNYGEAVAMLLKKYDPSKCDTFMRYFWNNIKNRLLDAQRRAGYDSEMEAIEAFERKIAKQLGREIKNGAITQEEASSYIEKIKNRMSEQKIIFIDINGEENNNFALFEPTDQNNAIAIIDIIRSIELMTDFINLSKSMGEINLGARERNAVSCFPEIHVDKVGTILDILCYVPNSMKRHETEFFKAFNRDFVDWIMRKPGCNTLMGLIVRRKKLLNDIIDNFDAKTKTEAECIFPLDSRIYLSFYKRIKRERTRHTIDNYKKTYTEFLKTEDKQIFMRNTIMKSKNAEVNQ